MSNAFTVLWTHDTCRALRKQGRVGARPSVAFSGVHQSLPSWASVRPGDDVYALHVNRCVLHVVSRLRVLDKKRRDCCGAAPTRWNDPAHPGHQEWSMLGADGCGSEAVHVEGTPVRFDLTVPGELVGALTFQNRRGEISRLKHVVDGRLERALSLQSVRRLTPESAVALAALLATTATSIDGVTVG